MNPNEQRNPRSLSEAETDNAAETPFGCAQRPKTQPNYVQTRLIASLPSNDHQFDKFVQTLHRNVSELC